MTTVNNPNSPNWIGLKGYGCAFMGAVARELAMSEQHTPGPWHWDSDPVKEDHLGRVRFRVCALGRTITPGPWCINKMADVDCGYGRTSGAITGGNGDVVVVFDPSEGEYGTALDPDGADAMLIASAPAMYEELCAILDWALTEKAPLRAQEIARIRAVLKAATGE